MSFPQPSLYYPLNISDVNLNQQLINWGSGTPSYDASLNTSYISKKNYKSGVGSVEFPKNNITGFTNVGDISSTYVCLAVAVSRDQLKMITCETCGLQSYRISYSKRISTANDWSARVQFGLFSTTNYHCCDLTVDGTRGVTCIYGGHIYFFNWTGDQPDPLLTPTLETEHRLYKGLAITSDGSRMIASTEDGIFFATWNGTNYSALQQTLNTRIGMHIGTGISTTGDRVVYRDTSSNWYIAFWNGTNYDNGRVFHTDFTARTARFSADASVLFLSAGFPGDVLGSVKFGRYDLSMNTYSYFTYVDTSLIPAKIDMHGLCYVNVSGGEEYIYASGSRTTYCLKINYKYTSPAGTFNLLVHHPLNITDYPYRGIAVSQNELRMIVTSPDAGYISYMYYSTRSNTVDSWSTPEPFTGLTTGYRSACSLTADGTRGATSELENSAGVRGDGLVYFFTWPLSDLNPGTLVQTLDTTRRPYTGITMRPDGAVLIALGMDNIYFATWDDVSLNYTTFTQTLDTTLIGHTFGGVCISNTGDRIVFSDMKNDGSKERRISFWNGTNYGESKIFQKDTSVPRSACFSADAMILYLSYYNDTSGSVQYGTWNPYLKTYTDFRYISTTLIPASLDLHGLQCIDGLNCGYLYMAHYGGNRDVSSTYYLQINYKTPSVRTSYDQTSFVSLPSFQATTNGLSISTWFRSNNNKTWARIFEFGNAATVGVGLAIRSGYLYYNVNNSPTDVGSEPVMSLYPINDNSWNHFAVTSSYVSDTTSRTSHVVFYLNGVQISETSNIFLYPRQDVFLTGNNLGKSSWTVDPEFYGNIDDFRVYDSVLTSDHIKKIYTQDAIVNNFVKYRSCKIYKLTTGTVDSAIGNTWGTSTNMGTNSTCYYWIDPYANTNAYINFPNPVRFTYIYNNTTGSTISANLYAIIDDITTGVYVNGELKNIGDLGWGKTKTPTSVQLIPGANTFVFGCVNSGGPAAFAVYVTDSTSGDMLFNTNSDISGWTAEQSGFYFKNIPLTAYIRNDNVSEPNTTCFTAETTHFRAGGNDISLNMAVSRISPYNTLGFSVNNTDLRDIFYKGGEAPL